MHITAAIRWQRVICLVQAGVAIALAGFVILTSGDGGWITPAWNYFFLGYLLALAATCLSAGVIAAHRPRAVLLGFAFGGYGSVAFLTIFEIGPAVFVLCVVPLLVVLATAVQDHDGRWAVAGGVGAIATVTAGFALAYVH